MSSSSPAVSGAGDGEGDEEEEEDGDAEDENGRSGMDGVGFESVQNGCFGRIKRPVNFPLNGVA